MQRAAIHLFAPRFPRGLHRAALLRNRSIQPHRHLVQLRAAAATAAPEQAAKIEGDSTGEPSTQPSPPTQSAQPQSVQQQLSVQPADAATQPETVIWYTGPATATTTTVTVSVPVEVSSSILWTDDNSISNLDDIRDWHRDNTFMADFLHMALPALIRLSSTSSGKSQVFCPMVSLRGVVLSNNSKTTREFERIFWSRGSER